MAPENRIDRTPRERYTEDGVLDRLNYGAIHAGRLTNRLSILPRVDENGYSECPFAENLYAEKEAEEKGFPFAIAHVRRYVPVVERELDRTEQEMEEIRSERERLYHDEPSKEFDRAAQASAAWRKRVQSHHKSLLSLVKEMEQLLARSRAKKFPGREPKKSFGALPLSPSMAMAPPMMSGGNSTPVSVPLAVPPVPLLLPPSLAGTAVSHAGLGAGLSGLMALGSLPGRRP